MANEGSSRRSFLSQILASLAGCLALRPRTAQAQHGSPERLPIRPSEAGSLVDSGGRRVISVKETMAQSTAYGAVPLKVSGTVFARGRKGAENGSRHVPDILS